MLSKRSETILKIIVGEYIVTASAVPSETIASRYSLRVSSATVRNEMARLEEEGYITRPHISAGGIPSDKAYRYYVESLIEEGKLAPEEYQAIRQRFQQSEQRLEEWMRLATTLLAQKMGSLALGVPPPLKECHIRHLELVTLQEFLVLLVLVLEGMRVRQHLFTVEQAVTQDELNAISNKLNASYRGLTCSQIGAYQLQLSPLEEQVSARVTRAMQDEDESQHNELYTDGLRHLLAQPEFSTTTKMLNLMEMLEEKSVLRNLLVSLGSEPGMRVAIGRENEDKLLQDCSVLLHSYGTSSRRQGTLGIIGPTRMPYAQAIATLTCLSSIISELMEDAQT